MNRWMLSQFATDANGNLYPICSAYGNRWQCPRWPATPDGWALVCIMTAPQQIEAAGQDPRVVVCPLPFDPAAVPAAVVTAYASWGVTAGMSMGAVLAKLAETEPIFGQAA